VKIGEEGQILFAREGERLSGASYNKNMFPDVLACTAYTSRLLIFLHLLLYCKRGACCLSQPSLQLYRIRKTLRTRVSVAIHEQSKHLSS
jgi:hypothetical protein